MWISYEKMLKISEPYHNVLMGRFPFSQPPMEIVHKFFISSRLKGSCLVGIFDLTHIIIQPELEKDYTKLFVRRT